MDNDDMDLDDLELESDIAPLTSGNSSSSGGGGGEPLSNHPTARFFHLFFKISALTLYLLAGFFSDNFILIFVACILLLAFDFWTVKNITGKSHNKIMTKLLLSPNLNYNVKRTNKNR